MKNFLAVFTTNFKYCWRNPVSVAVLIGFPILLIFVLGNALGSYMTATVEFAPTKIAAVVESEQSPFAEYISGEEMARFFEVTFCDYDTATQMLGEYKVQAVFLEKNGNISVIEAPDGFDTEMSMPVGMSLSIVDAYSQINAAMTYALTHGANPAELAEVLSADITVAEVPLGLRVVDSMDYYAVTMLVMILMFTGMNGLEVFKKGLISTSGERSLVAPVSKPSLIGGLLASSTLTGYLQGLIVFLFSLLVYDVYWGDRIGLVLLTLFGVTLFAQALAIFLLLFFKNPNTTMVAMQIIIWCATFVASGFTKIDFGAAEKLFRFSPSSLAQTVIFGAAYGGNESRMTTDLAILFVYGIVLFILAFILGKRRISE